MKVEKGVKLEEGEVFINAITMLTSYNYKCKYCIKAFSVSTLLCKDKHNISLQVDMMNGFRSGENVEVVEDKIFIKECNPSTILIVELERGINTMMEKAYWICKSSGKKCTWFT